MSSMRVEPGLQTTMANLIETLYQYKKSPLFLIHFIILMSFSLVGFYILWQYSQINKKINCAEESKHHDRQPYI